MGHRAGLDKCGKSRPPTENRTLDRPARSKPLYRLNYNGYVLSYTAAKLEILGSDSIYPLVPEFPFKF